MSSQADAKITNKKITPLKTTSTEKLEKHLQEKKEQQRIEKAKNATPTAFTKTLNTVLNNVLANRCIKVHGFVKGNNYGIKINNPTASTPLYAIELKTASNVRTELNKEDIDNISSVGGKHNFIIWALVKNAFVQKNYIFSYNLEIIKNLSSRFGVKLIEADKMLNVLYDLTLDNQHKHNTQTNGFDRAMDLSENLSYKYVHEGYNRIIANAVLDNLEKYDLFQSIGYKDLESSFEENYKREQVAKQTNISRLFGLGFKGVVYTYINFGKGAARALLDGKIKETKFADGDTANALKVYIDAIKENMISPISMNTVLMIEKNKDEYDIDDSVYSEIGDCLGLQFQRYSESSFKRKKIMRYTPLIYRNDNFTEVLNRSYLYGYICSVHKELSKFPQMFGTDHNGAFTNYNLKYPTLTTENTREHIFVGGETGSSKTTFVNAMKSQMIKFDWKNYEIGDMNGFKFREFDIKKSLRPFSEFVKKHNPNSVSIMETNLKDFAYNLVSCGFEETGEVKQTDISFAVETTSFIIEAQDKSLKSGLSYDEKSLYRSLIENTYTDYKYEHITINALSEYQKALADELYNLGYTPSTTLDMIKEEEYAYLNKPTLTNVIALLNKMYANNDIEKDETQYDVVKSLRKKLTTIIRLGEYTNIHGKKIPGYYNRYEAFDLNSDKRWLLFDMDSIKGNEGDYAPIQWILINRMVNQDKADQIALRAKGLPEPKIIVFLEEAHNVFTSSMFKGNDYFEKAAREWRSYNIIICAISQKSWHIPKEVFDAIETKFFLFPGDESVKENNGESKDVQILGNKDNIGIKDLLGLNDKSVELMFNTPKYTACGVNGVGTFTIKLHTTSKMRLIFDNKYKPNEM